jgi:membrane protein DedA with SNARE-associated domain
VLAIIGQFVQNVIASFGLFGVGLLMGIESCGIPLPSEVILPFSGSLVSNGQLSFWPVVIASTIGCVIGSLPLYWIGKYVGRDLILKYGKYVLLTKKEVDLCDRIFQKYGWWATFFGRLLPGIRTYIALPAGVGKMPIITFIIASAVGSFLWSIPLTYVGVYLGDNWHNISPYMHKFDAVIVVVLAVIIVWFLWHRIKQIRSEHVH